MQVIDVLDLRVGPESVVVAAEVRLAIREEYRLVLSAADCRHGEVPPLGEEECRDEDDKRDRDVPKAPAVRDEPADPAAEGETEPVQRVGLGLGVVLGRALALGAIVAGGAEAKGVCPDLNFLMSATMSPSSRRFSMKRTCSREMIIGSFGPCASLPRLMSCVPPWSDAER